MKRRPPCRWKWKCTTLLSLWLAGAGAGRATGYYGPSEYLAQGGQQADLAPEFYWELEVKRLATAFRPASAPRMDPAVFPPHTPGQGWESDEAPATVSQQRTSNADTADFEDALKTGRIKPADAGKARAEHEAAREELGPDADVAWTRPAFASEFSDYDEGAHFFHLGPEHFGKARQAWERLLARPAPERHYRSVWAAFMLGKVSLKEGKLDAPAWFQKCRALAKEGFADSLALAADSYGWEGRSEWKQGHPEKAAPLFLTQLALGDESAVISLKALIPDRSAVEGMLNYGPEPDSQHAPTAAELQAAQRETKMQLLAAARDPLLRRLATVHILATETGYRSTDEDPSPEPRENRIARWLGVLKEAGVEKPEEAEYLGFAAYQLGDYKGAAHWLEMAKNDSPITHWLRAKLQRRAGQAEAAAKSMVLAWQKLQTVADYSGWKPPARPSAEPAEEENSSGRFGSGEEGWGFIQHAGGNLGCLLLARGDFLQGFQAFYQGGLWSDAAFVAESILTVDELKSVVDHEVGAHPPLKADAQKSDLDKLRYLLGRRLVRVDRYPEAADYLPAPYDHVLQVYAKALEDGANTKLDQKTRAQAWFKAAWLARYSGMEIMGTEVAPDSFETEGSFESGATAEQRRAGRYVESSYDPKKGREVKTAKPLVLKPTAAELERLKKFRTAPEVRFHYRVIAGVLAMKAAALLPDNTPELADVINCAGGWVSAPDNKAADSYFLALMKRAPKTAIGKAAKTKRWFVGDSGPWSKREAEEHQKLVPNGN